MKTLKNLIRKIVMRDDRYSFSIENGLYTIPAFIYSQDGNRINVKDNREKQLRSRESKYVQKFKTDLAEIRSRYKGIEKKLMSSITEFPVPIENHELWNTVLSKQGIPSENVEFRGRKYFILDFFFHYIGLVVEIDSDYHNTRLAYDRARDEYLKIMYGLETIRISKYGDSVLSNNKNKQYVENTVLKKVSDIKYCFNYSPFPLDFSETMINNFIRDNKYSLEFLGKMESYLGDLFTYKDSICITKKDLFCIDPYNFVAGLRKDQETLFLNSASMMLKKLWNKDLYVHDTKEFSLGDVLRILELLNTRQFTWDGFLGESIPMWMVYITGLPPANYTNDSLPENLMIRLPQVGSSNECIDIFMEQLKKSNIIFAV